MKKGFLDGYKTYDTSTGHGSTAEWQRAFSAKMGLEEARKALGLPADAGWEAICQALRLAATESMARLVGDYVSPAWVTRSARPRPLPIFTAPRSSLIRSSTRAAPIRCGGIA